MVTNDFPQQTPGAIPLNCLPYSPTGHKPKSAYIEFIGKNNQHNERMPPAPTLLPDALQIRRTPQTVLGLQHPPQALKPNPPSLYTCRPVVLQNDTPWPR